MMFHDADIKDLDSLQLCVNLVELSLEGNAITDLTGLSSLTSLVRLNLTSNKITSLGA
jgi:Leucine-rich repeat (LRR) protein